MGSACAQNKVYKGKRDFNGLPSINILHHLENIRESAAVRKFFFWRKFVFFSVKKLHTPAACIIMDNVALEKKREKSV